MAKKVWGADAQTKRIRAAKRSLDVLLREAPRGFTFRVEALPRHLRRAVVTFQALGACFGDRVLIRAGVGRFKVGVAKNGCNH